MIDPQYIVIAVVVIVGIVLFVKMHSQGTSTPGTPPAVPPAIVVPPSAPATVADVKSLTDRIETASGIKALAKRVEDLHARWDKEDGQKQGGQQEEKKG
jgi:hypothetical protein